MNVHVFGYLKSLLKYVIVCKFRYVPSSSLCNKVTIGLDLGLAHNRAWKIKVWFKYLIDQGMVRSSIEDKLYSTLAKHRSGLLKDRVLIRANKVESLEDVLAIAPTKYDFVNKDTERINDDVYDPVYCPGDPV